MAPPIQEGSGNGQERDRSAGGTASPNAGPSTVAQAKQNQERYNSKVIKEDYESDEEVLDLDALLRVDLNAELKPGLKSLPQSNCLY